jgi:hypothetical protein
MNDSKEVVFSESHREVAGRFLKAINKGCTEECAVHYFG